MTFNFGAISNSIMSTLSKSFELRATMIAQSSYNKVLSGAYAGEQAKYAELTKPRAEQQEEDIVDINRFEDIILKNNKRMKDSSAYRQKAISKQIDDLKKYDYDSQTLLQKRGELRMERVEERLKSFKTAWGMDSSKARARELQAISNEFKLAVGEYLSSTKTKLIDPTTMEEGETLVRESKLRSYNDIKFEETARKRLSELKSLIRLETLKAARVEDLKERSNSLVTLGQGNSALTKSGNLMNELRNSLNIRFEEKIIPAPDDGLDLEV